MELTIEQPCPSCGAAICINESDRIIGCEFCGIKNYRIHQQLPRYVLPEKVSGAVDPADILYMPYLRFKGAVFYCQGNSVRHKFIDTTRVGNRLKGLPVSLGLRPQAMNVSPATRELSGRFVPQNLKAATIFAEAAKLTTLFDKDKKSGIVHRAFIGETVSRIYLPVYERKGMLIDGITNNSLGPEKIGDSAVRPIEFDSSWEPRFLSTICPDCGAGLAAAGNSLVLHCENCTAAWVEEKARFVRIQYNVATGKSADTHYLPFWRIQVEEKNVGLYSLADLIEITNQPVVANRSHRDQKLAFFIPAFKLNPNAFLNTARNITLLQQSFIFEEDVEKVHRIPKYQVNLPYVEAIQALRTVLAASAVSAKRVMEVLADLQFVIKDVQLIYLPFEPGSHDWLEKNTGFSISSAALRFGRSL